jgi:hypothetical protein
MQTRPIAPGLTFGAVVTGADLARLAPAEWSTIERTFVERGVLVAAALGPSSAAACFSSRKARSL